MEKEQNGRFQLQYGFLLVWSIFYFMVSLMSFVFRGFKFRYDRPRLMLKERNLQKRKGVFRLYATTQLLGGNSLSPRRFTPVYVVGVFALNLSFFATRRWLVFGVLLITTYI